jgi:hypothetical protein
MPKRSVFLPKTRHHKKKFLPKISTENDDGWTLEQFLRPMAMIQIPLPPHTDTHDMKMDPKEFHRLTNPKNGMFKKWANVTNTSAIARFMREGLDPRKKYSKKEMQDLCKEYGIVLANIMMPYTHGKGGGVNGQIITKKGKYMMYPSLRKAFNDHF